MNAYTGNTDTPKIHYIGPNRRYGNERRVARDPRRIARFDAKGGDRRSGFARRDTDEGFRYEDFPELKPGS